MLASVEQLQRYLHTTGTVSGGSLIDANLLGELLAAASDRMTEAATDRTLELAPAKAIDTPATEDTPATYEEGEPLTLTFPLAWGQRIVVVPDLRSVTSMTVGGQELAESDYVLRRRHPRELCALWVKLRRPHYGGELVITGHWGPAGAKVGTDLPDLDVRADVREACIVWAARGFHNRQARYADQTQDPAGAVTNYFRKLPADVAVVIDSLEVPHV